ncbi:N-acetyltransferase family protein [Natrinema sp. HArc-T2]|uniref:GNAT family N-acetyltransferase n=1 Tax=Natrinema sp. HArc-T2 TaxID=3242701 RepID=UPI00359E4101
MTVGSETATPACTAWDNGECEGTPHCPPRCPRFRDADGDAFIARCYRSSDRESLLTMYEEIDDYNRTMGLPPKGRSRLETWVDRLTTNGWNLVVVADDRIVGHTAVVPADSDSPEFIIFVHQDFQNSGIGSELIKQLIAYAKDKNHQALTLEVAKGNKQAISVYQNIGFEVTNRKLSELAMALELQLPIADQVQRPPAKRE